VVYTNPEIAGVGLTEEAGPRKGEIKVGKFPMLANSRAKTNHEPDGFVKVIADAATDRVLGVWCIASLAGTMIAEAALAWNSARRPKTSPIPATRTRRIPKR
jgi:dihydrolipoamide dehydrogenase